MKQPRKRHSGAELVNPYDDSRPKGQQVEEMFDSIAPAYDFMNTAMTFGLHRYWRNRALRDVLKDFSLASPSDILDIATGTGDLAFRLANLLPESKVTGIDLSEGMIAEAKTKLEKEEKAIADRISFMKADATDIPLSQESCDLVTVAYGVRNFEDLRAGYREMHRVLRHGGKLCVIELSQPAGGITRGMYDLYSRNLIPLAGRLVSGDSRAYSYLPESIAAAPQREDMTSIIRECGFSTCRWKSLTFGAVTYYIATK